MKKYIISIFAISSILIILALTDQDNNAAYANASGAPAGYTGSPGDNKNCTACHSGTASSQNGLITSTIPVTGYTGDSTYTITASITTAGVVKFGFEVSPQNTSGGEKGTLVITNSTHTQLVGSGKYITQKLAGTSGTGGSITWTFNWTAPVAGSGDVTFYGAFNSSNNDGTTDGDKITLSQMLVHENITTLVHEPYAAASVNVFPNPASSFINITPVSGKIINLVTVFDLSGKKVLEEVTSGNEDIRLDIRTLNAGIYILTMNINGEMIIEKIVVS